MSASLAAAPAPLVLRFSPPGPAPVSPLTPLALGLPVLGGVPEEALFACTNAEPPSGAFARARAGAWLVGWAALPVADDLAAQTQALYTQLFAAARGYQLCRIWNYVPAINAPASAGGLENYRAFSRGRSLAFEQAYGACFKQRLPAASAVGTDDDRLVVVFAATVETPAHFENPLQVPAYDYPLEHGPRSPSFARASVVTTPMGRAAFVSGTAAIRGHHTVAPGDTAAQLDCTIENLRTLAQSCGLGADLAAGRAARRHFKVYLRHAADYAATARTLTPALFQPADQVTYVRSDICRTALNVEIEATLFGVP